MPIRRLAALAGLAVLAACNSTDFEPGLPYAETIPANAQATYKLDPALIYYDYVDSSAGQLTHLVWLADQPYAGYTCVAFVPQNPGVVDTVGTFVFVARGPNQGRVERHLDATVDTTNGYLLSGREGSRGAYLINSANQVALTWSNGSQDEYFHPTAQIRLSGDTLWSAVTLMAKADSLRASWQIGWVLEPC